MKGKLKKLLSKKLFYVILALLIIGIIEVGYAATLINSKNVSYNNSTSKLSSTNVQGAIDELYNNCKDVKEECPDGQTCINDSQNLTILKKSLNISGNGLYQDTVEKGKYFYRGKDVKNYIRFNNELWRILSIDINGTIKIIRDDSIGIKPYGSSVGRNSNDWISSSLNTYLNDDYYNSINNDKIFVSTWNIGEIANNKDTVTNINDVYNSERSTIWTGKIALFTVSEYIRTNSNSSCIVVPSNYSLNYETCNKTTWLYNGTNEWTLSRLESDWHDYSWYIKNGQLNFLVANQNQFNVRPTLNLKPSIQITGGDGSKDNAYTLKD